MTNTYIYDLVIGTLLRHPRERVTAISQIESGESVLDVGCGTADQSLHYARKGAKVTGMDLDKDMLKAARRKTNTYDNITILEGDASKLKGKFDKTHASLLLHGLEEKTLEHVLDSMASVTEKNIIIMDYALSEEKCFGSWFYRNLIRFFERTSGHNEQFKDYMRRGGITQAEKYLANAGFHVEEKETVAGGHIAIVRFGKGSINQFAYPH